MKRRAETTQEEQNTPILKKLRSAECLRRSVRTEQPAPPVFVIEEDSDSSSNMPGSPKPPTADEFKSMLREGLSNVAKKEHLDQMMQQIKGNSQALISLERKMEPTNESNERRFKLIEG